VKCIKGVDKCVFITTDGLCTIPKGCSPVIEECKTANLGKSCSKIGVFNNQELCSAYINPKLKWIKDKSGVVVKRCPLSYEKVDEEKKKALNPLKASKKSMGK
jgi:hypothetical protein